MAEGAAASLGLFGGALLLLAARWLVERGRRGLAGGATATLTEIGAMALGPVALCVAAQIQGFPGAALGVVAGSFVVNALLAAVVAASGANGQAQGARRFAIVSALAAAVLILAVFNGEVSRVEGALMLLAALAVAAWAARSQYRAGSSQKPASLSALAWLALGTLAMLGGAWLAISGTATLSTGRPDGDLVTGLSILALAAALPNVAVAWRARREGEGGAAFVDIAAGSAATVLGGVGAGALVRPLTAPEAFLGLPALAAAASALSLIGLALGGLRAPTPVVALAGAVYAAFLWAFVRGVA
jgi:cation:H+ antiporter